MRHDKLKRELELIMCLLENRHYTIDDLCERLELSKRNVYYYLQFFREAGFIVEYKRPYYKLSMDSPFFKKIHSSIHITEEEAIIIRRLLDQTGDTSVQTTRQRQKLSQIYDLDIVNSPEERRQEAENLSVIYDAIKAHCCIAIKGYSSPHSNTVKDRIVEPFLLMNNNREVRCFEIDSQMNKTFKISRMKEVKFIELLWNNTEKHREMHTDLFMFSGEEQLPVKLRLGRLACSVIKEEYYAAEQMLVADGPDHWLLDINVCSYVGIGRFVVGLLEDIEIIDSPEFKDYINNKISTYKKLLS